MPAFDLTALQIGDLVTSGKGAKTAPFTSEGKSVFANLGPMQIPFEPSAFQDPEATRVNMVFRPPEAVIQELQELDEFILQTVSKDPARWWGKVRSETQIRESYNPIVKLHDKYPPSLKAKTNLEPPYQLKVWDATGAQRGPPLEWKDLTVKPRIKLKNLYFMGAGAFGATLECTDAQIVEEPVEACPFA